MDDWVFNTDIVLKGLPPDSIELVSELFTDNPLVVIAPPGHPHDRVRSIPLERLSQYSVELVVEAKRLVISNVEGFSIQHHWYKAYQQ